MNHHERDLELIRQLKQGNEELRYVIPYNYIALIYKYAMSLSRDYPDIDPDDLVQDTIIQIGQKIHEFDESRGVQVITYLAGLAIGFIKSNIRGHKSKTKRQVSIFKIVGKNEDFLVNILSGDDDDPSKNSIDIEISEYLATHVKELDQLERQIIEGVVAGVGLKEMSKTMGIKLPKLKEIYRRAKKKLRNSMKDYKI